MLPSQKRIAFTIFELLVILVILAMLLGFLVPFILKAREQAARAQKMNNLREVLIAVHGFHNVHGQFPPATGSFNDVKDQTISVYLLPYVEQQNLYLLILAGMKFPDVQIRPYIFNEDPSTKDFVRVQNYAANVRIFTDEGFTTDWNKTVTLKSSMTCGAKLTHITDGTSNTIAFATRYAASEKISENGKAATPCGYYDLPLANNGGSFFGATPMTGMATATSTSGWQVMPTLAEVNCSSKVGMAHAFEKSGLLVGFADGHVQLISPNVSSQNWNYFLQPNDGNDVERSLVAP